MKKVVWIIVASILGITAIAVLGLYFLLLANRASTPDSIARRVGLKLPAYEITKEEDNMDRTASAWSYYYYEIKFKEPLSERFFENVEKIGTRINTREGDKYIVSAESPDSWNGRVCIDPVENTATLEYEFWDALF